MHPCAPERLSATTMAECHRRKTCPLSPCDRQMRSQWNRPRKERFLDWQRLARCWRQTPLQLIRDRVGLPTR